MKNKKAIFAVVGGVIILLLFFLNWLFGWTSKSQETDTKKTSPAPARQEVSLPKEEEPEIILDINSDRSGAILVVKEIADNFSQLEYELIYMAESEDLQIERGVAGGPLDISNGEVRESLLFGTESCTTGVCKRHIDKNVSSGILTIRLIDQKGKGWSVEKGFTIEKLGGVWEAVWAE